MQPPNVRKMSLNHVGHVYPCVHRPHLWNLRRFPDRLRPGNLPLMYEKNVHLCVAEVGLWNLTHYLPSLSSWNLPLHELLHVLLKDSLPDFSKLLLNPSHCQAHNWLQGAILHRLLWNDPHDYGQFPLSLPGQYRRWLLPRCTLDFALGVRVDSSPRVSSPICSIFTSTICFRMQSEARSSRVTFTTSTTCL